MSLLFRVELKWNMTHSEHSINVNTVYTVVSSSRLWASEEPGPREYSLPSPCLFVILHRTT